MWLSRNRCSSSWRPWRSRSATRWRRVVSRAGIRSSQMYTILISCNKMEVNYLKIIQCDFLDSQIFWTHSWVVPTMKITVGKVGKLEKWQCIKYLFAPLIVTFSILPRKEDTGLTNSKYFCLMLHCQIALSCSGYCVWNAMAIYRFPKYIC